MHCFSLPSGPLRPVSKPSLSSLTSLKPTRKPICTSSGLVCCQGSELNGGVQQRKRWYKWHIEEQSETEDGEKKDVLFFFVRAAQAQLSFRKQSKPLNDSDTRCIVGSLSKSFAAEQHRWSEQRETVTELSLNLSRFKSILPQDRKSSTERFIPPIFIIFPEWQSHPETDWLSLFLSTGYKLYNFIVSVPLLQDES